MDRLPLLDQLSEPQKDALIPVLWAEVQTLGAQVAELHAKTRAPKKDAHNSSGQALRWSAIFPDAIGVTNGFRSDWGRDLFAVARSVVDPGKRQGLSPFQAIQRALSLRNSLFDPG